VVARLAPFLPALLLTGCVSHHMHRPEPADYLREISSNTNAAPYALAFVEFDDQGELWKPAQLEAAGEYIARENQISSNGVVVIIFLHGWKNDATPQREKKGNLRQFKKVLEQLALREQGQNTEIAPMQRPAARPVIGVFLAWRGLTLKVPLLKEATFWPRMSTAKRVASPALSEVVYKLMDVTKENPDSKCIVVGHSFGGMILERTMSQTLLSLLYTHKEAGFEVPADLILVVNPAQSAIEAKKFMDVLRRCDARMVVEDENGDTRPVDAPLVLSITSERDLATKMAYPFGMFWVNLFKRFRFSEENLPGQRTLSTHTIGHVPELQSHRVKESETGIELARIEQAWNDTPYWTVQVPGSLIGGHSDIFRARFAEFLIGLMTRNEIYSPSSRLKLVREIPGDVILFRDEEDRPGLPSDSEPDAVGTGEDGDRSNDPRE